MIEEIWKDIDGFENTYQISNYGNIKSLDRYVKCNKGYRFHKGKIIKQGKSNEKRNYVYTFY